MLFFSRAQFISLFSSRSFWKWRKMHHTFRNQKRSKNRNSWIICQTNINKDTKKKRKTENQLKSIALQIAKEKKSATIWTIWNYENMKNKPYKRFAFLLTWCLFFSLVFFFFLLFLYLIVARFYCMYRLHTILN